MTTKLLTAARRAVAEMSAVGVFGILALALLGVEIADEALEGESHGLDRAILLALRETGDSADPIGPPWVEHAIADITALGGYAVLTLIVLGVAGYLFAIGKRGAPLLVIGAVASGALLSESLKAFFGRPRPDLVAHLADVSSASFPSGHAMLSAVTYLTLGALLARLHEKKRVKALVLGWAIGLTLLIGASRVYLGVHWPTDVLAGWALGAAWAGLWWMLALMLQTMHKLEGAAPE